MIRLASVISDFEADFLRQFRHRLSFDQLRALAAIKHCRSPASSMMQVQCTDCAHHRLVPHSCGHRLCPHCQHHESQQWLERQMQRLVPADYFLLTFTLPAELRGLAVAHADIALDLLMRCAWETVHRFSQNDRQLQGTPGAIAVLHTHSRRLDFHPHVHLVVPAAAVDAAKQRWRCKRRGKNGTCLFNAKAVAKVFRAKMLAAIEAAGIPLPARYPQEWVAHCKSVGTGQKALIYLGRYLYRGGVPRTGHRRLRERPGEIPLSQCRNQQVAKAHARRHRFPLVDRPARTAQGISPRPQLRLSARQLQAPYWFAASVAEVRSRPFYSATQATTTDALLLLWRCDGDRQDADSIDIARSRRRPAGPRGSHLIM